MSPGPRAGLLGSPGLSRVWSVRCGPPRPARRSDLRPWASAPGSVGPVDGLRRVKQDLGLAPARPGSIGSGLSASAPGSGGGSVGPVGSGLSASAPGSGGGSVGPVGSGLSPAVPGFGSWLCRSGRLWPVGLGSWLRRWLCRSGRLWPVARGPWLRLLALSVRSVGSGASSRVSASIRPGPALSARLDLAPALVCVGPVGGLRRVEQGVGLDPARLLSFRRWLCRSGRLSPARRAGASARPGPAPGSGPAVSVRSVVSGASSRGLGLAAGPARPSSPAPSPSSSVGGLRRVERNPG